MNPEQTEKHAKSPIGQMVEQMNDAYKKGELLIYLWDLQVGIAGLLQDLTLSKSSEIESLYTTLQSGGEPSPTQLERVASKAVEVILRHTNQFY